MHELTHRLVQQAGLTPEQAEQSISIIKAFVTEKFPMLEGAVNSLFAAGPDPMD